MSQTTKNDQRPGSLIQVGARLPMPADSGIAPEQWRVLTDAIWPAAKTAEAIKLAFDYCKARNLDPFKRPVHIVPMWNKQLRCEVETVWPGISEIQTTASRTGEWAGMDAPQWGPDVTKVFKGKKKEWVSGREVWSDVETEVTYPESCCVTVYRMVKGVRCPFSEPVYWTENYATMGKSSDVPNDMWARRARGQIHKCAKAASLRAAFPEELGSTAVAEEMEGKVTEAGGVVIEGTAEKEPTSAGVPTLHHTLEAPPGRLEAIADKLVDRALRQEAAQIDLRGQQQNQAPNVAANVVPPPPESPELELQRKKRKGAERYTAELAAQINTAIEADTTEELVIRGVLLVINNEKEQNKLNELKVAHSDLYNIVLDACCNLTVVEGILEVMEIAYPAFYSDLNARSKWHMTPCHTMREPIEEMTN